ncbi:JAB domain-containing protein [Flavobacterium nitratireducens]|uniref:JAB domain-containing protein n=1 Tax=Flavobacterium nitratireducens TaxID=992289 RepID=UPI0024155005|nr:JAB domain-containing protein [Flavobacterium nitratireducens]
MTYNIPEIKIAVSFDKNLKKSELVKITSSRDAYEVFKRVFNADTFDWCEEVVMLCVNNSNKVVGFYKVSSGGMTGTIIDVRMIFTTALKSLATGIIIAHNHPSGTLTPSEADKSITRKIKEAGQFLDIKVLDHLIITDESYFSFVDEGIF